MFDKGIYNQPAHQLVTIDTIQLLSDPLTHSEGVLLR